MSITLFVNEIIHNVLALKSLVIETVGTKVWNRWVPWQKSLCFHYLGFGNKNVFSNIDQLFVFFFVRAKHQYSTYCDVRKMTHIL